MVKLLSNWQLGNQIYIRVMNAFRDTNNEQTLFTLNVGRNYMPTIAICGV